jgi:hypothetical protein
MAEDPVPDQTKQAIDALIAEGDYRVGGPGPHLTEDQIAELTDELDARLDRVIPAGTELEQANARIDAYQYFLARVLGVDPNG